MFKGMLLSLALLPTFKETGQVLELPSLFISNLGFFKLPITQKETRDLKKKERNHKPLYFLSNH